MPIKGKQVINGKAFEYSIAMQYFNYLHDLGLNVCLIENKAYATAYKSYNEVSEEEKNKFNQAAFNTIDTLIKIEPGLITQKNENDTLNISINTDQSGENGDVRDIIFQRKESKWEIGISAKNNNDAVKHSRLSNSADFGLSWFGVPCSKDYWAEIQPVFNYIEECIASKLTWKNVNDKKRKVYVPLLIAFKNELMRIYQANENIPSKLIKYLIGKQPFYKIIKDDTHNLVIVKAYNIENKLNKPYNKIKSAYSTPRINLPHRIVEFEFKENSETTLNMILDCGWEISFRIHSADGLVVRSLKFDIQLLGNPPVLFTQHIFQ